MFMNRQDILENIKMQFKKMFATDDVATATFTTDDGKTIIVIGADAGVGIEAYELASDGTQSPLSNGDYKLTDGRILSIIDNKISEVKLPEAPKAEETPIEEMLEETPIEEIKDEIDYEDRISAIENQLAELMTMIGPLLDQTEKLMSSQKEMFTKVQKIANEPDGEKIITANKFATTEKAISNDLDSMRERLKNLQFEKHNSNLNGTKVKPNNRLEKIAQLAKSLRK